MKETVVEGILKVAGGVFLSIIAITIVVGVYVWVVDKWERVMDSEGASPAGSGR